MMSLIEGFQAAYRIPTERSMLKQRAMAVFLVLIVALPAVGASCWWCSAIVGRPT